MLFSSMLTPVKCCTKLTFLVSWGAAENAGRDGEAAGVELNLVLKLIHGTFPGTNVDNSIGV